jgi:hypothetical protein
VLCLIRETPIGSSPIAHARYLHGEGKGHITLAHKPGWHQHSYSLEKLYEILPPYGGMADVYISPTSLRIASTELAAMTDWQSYPRCTPTSTTTSARSWPRCMRRACWTSPWSSS